MRDIVEPEDQKYPKVVPLPQPRIIWYVDPEMKRAQRDMVKAGTRHKGKRIGRPRVTERPDFSQRFLFMRERLDRGKISRRRAAKELDMGYAALDGLLDRLSILPIVIDGDNSEKTLARDLPNLPNPKCPVSRVHSNSVHFVNLLL